MSGIASMSMQEISFGPDNIISSISKKKIIIDIRILTDPDISPIPIMQPLNILVHLPPFQHAHHPELRDFRGERAGIVIEGVHRREAVRDDRAG